MNAQLIFLALLSDIPDHQVTQRYSRHDFETLSVEELEKITGVNPPSSDDPEAIARFRERAWRSWQQDWQNEHEYGTARQGDVEPER